MTCAIYIHILHICFIRDFAYVFRVLTNTSRSIGGLAMKGTLKNKLRKSIHLKSEVIAQYAGSTAVECFGIVGMAAVSMKDGLVKLLKGDSLTRGIKVEIDERQYD